MFKLLILLSVMSSPAYEVHGDFKQGGLVTLYAETGVDVYHDDKKLKNHTGKYLLGFDRDFAKSTNITFKRDGRIILSKDYEVAQRKYDIQKINFKDDSKVTPPQMDWARIKRENARIGAVRTNPIQYCPEVVFTKPSDGTVTGVFGSQRVLNGIPKRPHFGLDYAAPKGTPITAPASGTITLIDDDMFYTGGTIALDHGCGLVSIFSHLSAVDVKEGQHVVLGEVIGKIGSTGRSTGPHLDWRVNLEKIRLDPALLLD